MLSTLGHKLEVDREDPLGRRTRALAVEQYEQLVRVVIWTHDTACHTMRREHAVILLKSLCSRHL